MDIQLADGLSFEIFQRTEVNTPIIFTTAFDQYAIRAFKVNSIDYLLKPIRKVDLEDALKKFLSTSKTKNIEQELLKQLLGSMLAKQKRSGILVKEGSGFVQIAIADLLFFYSHDSITFGISAQRRYMIDETMDQLFQSLDTNLFFRINRGQIVAKPAIQRIEPYFNHRVKLHVLHQGNQEFIVSRPKTNEFKDWMNQ